MVDLGGGAAADSAGGGERPRHPSGEGRVEEMAEETTSFGRHSGRVGTLRCLWSYIATTVMTVVITMIQCNTVAKMFFCTHTHFLVTFPLLAPCPTALCPPPSSALSDIPATTEDRWGGESAAGLSMTCSFIIYKMRCARQASFQIL